MKLLLIANITGLALAAIGLTVLFVAYVRAEKKLAKHGESSIFGRAKK